MSKKIDAIDLGLKQSAGESQNLNTEWVGEIKGYITIDGKTDIFQTSRVYFITDNRNMILQFFFGNDDFPVQGIVIQGSPEDGAPWVGNHVIGTARLFGGFGTILSNGGSWYPDGERGKGELRVAKFAFNESVELIEGTFSFSYLNLDGNNVEVVSNQFVAEHRKG